MGDRIFLASPHMSGEGYEQQYIQEAFDTNWVAPLGKNVDEFEKELCGFVGAGSGVALNSGTAAIHLALKLAGVKKGDIVFCQSLTFSATANPILYEGAIPVFIGSEARTWNLCPKALRAAFEKYPNAKAVLAVHLYGIPCELDEIEAICREHDAVLIEDAAESLGSFYKGRHTGTIGRYGIFSFNGNKIITTSGGGMLVSDDAQAIGKARFWATQARDQARHYEHSEIGYNYRMSNICAGIGRGQLRVLQERIEQKNAIDRFYKENLKDLEGVGFMPELEDCEQNRWLSVITLNGKVRPLDVILALEKENIESRPVWKPMHLQPVFAEYDYVGDGMAQWLFENGICLPSDTKMTKEQLEKICSIIRGCWSEQ